MRKFGAGEARPPEGKKAVGDKGVSYKREAYDHERVKIEGRKEPAVKQCVERPKRPAARAVKPGKIPEGARGENRGFARRIAIEKEHGKNASDGDSDEIYFIFVPVIKITKTKTAIFSIDFFIVERFHMHRVL